MEPITGICKRLVAKRARHGAHLDKRISRSEIRIAPAPGCACTRRATVQQKAKGRDDGSAARRPGARSIVFLKERGRNCKSWSFYGAKRAYFRTRQLENKARLSAGPHTHSDNRFHSSYYVPLRVNTTAQQISRTVLESYMCRTNYYKTCCPNK